MPERNDDKVRQLKAGIALMTFCPWCREITEERKRAGPKTRPKYQISFIALSSFRIRPESGSYKRSVGIKPLMARTISQGISARI